MRPERVSGPGEPGGGLGDPRRASPSTWPANAGDPASTGDNGGGGIDAALAAYQAVRPEHCRRVVTASRDWGALWHLDGEKRERRNEILRARDQRDYGFVDWLYSVTALTPAEEPPMFQTIPLLSADSASVT